MVWATAGRLIFKATIVSLFITFKELSMFLIQNNAKKTLTNDDLQEYIQLARQGDAEAQYNLGVCYANGIGITTDEKQAVEWFRKAAEQGYVNGAQAQYALGVCYEYGRGVAKDEKQAVELFSKAAEQNNANAQYALGVCYEHGRGVAKDEKQAFVWVREAAEQNNAEAQSKLGLYYAQGKIVSKDEKTAFAWCQKSSQQGCGSGQDSLGNCYENGWGVQKDLDQAFGLYQKSALQENASGQYNLGRFYENGFSAQKNLMQAVEWYQKAAAQGHIYATGDLKYLTTENPQLVVKTVIYHTKDQLKAKCDNTLSNTELNTLSVLPDGQLVTDSLKEIKLWNEKTGQCVQTLRGHKGRVLVFTILPDGRLVSASGDGTIKIWDRETGQCVQTLNHSNHVEWSDGVSALTVLPDGRLASGSKDKTVKIWDVKSGKHETLEIKQEINTNAFTALPDGRLAIGSLLWDVKTGQCVQMVSEDGYVTALTLLPDGRLASGWSDETIKLWDVKTGQCVQTLNDGHCSSVNALTVLPDGRLASGSRNTTIIKLWDVKAGQCVQTLSGHNAGVSAFLLLPDGRLASWSENKIIKIWNVGIQQSVQSQSAAQVVADVKQQPQISVEAQQKVASAVKLNPEQEAKEKAGKEAKEKADKEKLVAAAKDKLAHDQKSTGIANQNALKLHKEGTDHHERGHYDKALEYYDAALKLEPNRSVTLNNKGSALNDLGRHVEALVCLDAALKLDPGDTDAVTHSHKGHALASLGRHVEALAIFDAALKINSSNPKVYNGKANTLYRLNRWAEAQENFERVLQLNSLPEVLSGLISYNKSHSDYLLPKEGKQLAQAAIEKAKKEAKEKAAADAALKAQAETEAKLKAEREAKEKAAKEKAEQDKLITKDQKLADKDKELADLRAQLEQMKLQQNKPATPANDLSVSFVIPYGELQMGEKLGAGGFGVVHKGTWRFQNVAIKELLDEKPSAAAAADFKNEMQVMAKLRSSNVVQFYGCVLGNPKYCIVMEYMPKGSLFNLLRSNQTLDWSTRYKMTLDMACGLAFLHAENILHRDLKSLNVLLDEHYHAKLTDFGLSKVKTETRTTTKNQSVGSEGWIAPELTDPDGVYTQKSDVFSMGITMWEMATRRIPYEKASSRSMIPFWMAQNKREEIPTDCPPKIAHLIKWCWDTDPTKRPTAAEAVKYLRDAENDFKPSDNKPNQNDNAAQFTNFQSGSFAASYQGNTPVVKK